MTLKKIMQMILMLACLGGVGWAIWYCFIRQSDEAKIRQTLEQARQCLVKSDPHETEISASLHVGAIKKQMSGNVNVSIPAYDLHGEMPSHMIVKKILLAHKLLSRLDVRFDEIDVRFPDNGSDKAEVRFLATANYMERSGHYSVSHKILLRFCKHKQNWIICDVSDGSHGKENK